MSRPGGRALASGEPGQDLRVAPGPGLPGGLVVPAHELVEQFSRSSGPGGQSVNTADSRVELRFDVAASTAFTDLQRSRALARLGAQVAITASEHRSQHRNRVAARDRLAARIREALAPPPPTRVPTKPSRASQRRRVDSKVRRGQVKALRRRVRED
ncbi:MAG TPA: alternative ribosome rescue aminoacyl-tRNA hydrolase ArfB [Marmoricola sp.]|nr:alternative ribosome rescue aminoacyl-tRNA hydrolase ArfB [Marmoricola sp.]